MNYQTNSKYRKLRHRLSLLFSGVSFNFLHLRLSFRCVILGEIFILGSFFFPWFSLEGKNSFWIFSRFLGGLGTLLFISALVLLVLILSNSTKESLKKRMGIPVSDAASIVFFWVLQVLLILLAIQFLYSFSYFTKDVSYFDPPIYALVGAIVVSLWGILAFREQKREVLTTLYIENSQTTDAQFEEYRTLLDKWVADKKNMTLPV